MPIVRILCLFFVGYAFFGHIGWRLCNHLCCCWSRITCPQHAHNFATYQQAFILCWWNWTIVPNRQEWGESRVDITYHICHLISVPIWRGAKNSCEIMPTTILKSPELSFAAGMFHVEGEIIKPFQKKVKHPFIEVFWAGVEVLWKPHATPFPQVIKFMHLILYCWSQHGFLSIGVWGNFTNLFIIYDNSWGQFMWIHSFHVASCLGSTLDDNALTPSK